MGKADDKTTIRWFADTTANPSSLSSIVRGVGLSRPGMGKAQSQLAELWARLRSAERVRCGSLVAVEFLLELATLLGFERERCRGACQQPRNADGLTGFLAPAIVAGVDRYQ